MIIVMMFNLQIENFDGVSGTPRRFCNQLEAQRLEPEKHARVKQWSGMNKQQSQRGTLIPRLGGRAQLSARVSSPPARTNAWRWLITISSRRSSIRTSISV